MSLHRIIKGIIKRTALIASSILLTQLVGSVRPLLAQPSATEREAALTEVFEALHEDSAAIERQLESEAVSTKPIFIEAIAPSASFDSASFDSASFDSASFNVEASAVMTSADTDVRTTVPSVHLLEQLLAETVGTTAYKPPGADALGEPVSVGIASDALPALTTALKDENELVQLYAADALWSLTGDTGLVLPTLMAAAESDDIDTQELALEALAQLGEAALPAVPLLRDIVGERDSRTRQVAQDVLKIVQSENRPATVLGIIAREADRMGGFSALFRAIADLW